MTHNSILPIAPVLQQYAWGMPNGADSKVETLYKAQKNSPQKEYTTEDRFAELWMGCHPNGMAQVITDEKNTMVPFDQFVKENNLTDIRYMFKVLSVDKPLSLQLHPNKKVAEELHAKFPTIYKDPNHKPEIAIALSDEFHAMAGFRPMEFIEECIAKFPVIGEVLFGDEPKPEDYGMALEVALKNLVQPTENKEQIQSLIDKMVGLAKGCTDASEEMKVAFEVFEMLLLEYNGDKSVFCAFIMNRYILKKGECIYLNAGLLHAYLKGDCMECMASSDNVIRGGLTPKYIDVENLLKYTSFIPGGAQMIEPTEVVSNVTEYKPGVDDFVVKRVSVQGSISLSAKEIGCNGISMAVVMNGSGSVASGGESLSLEHGTVFALKDGFECAVTSEGMELWIATQ